MYDIALDHAGAISAALITLVFAFAFVFGLRFLAARRVAWAARIAQAYVAAPSRGALAGRDDSRLPRLGHRRLGNARPDRHRLQADRARRTRAADAHCEPHAPDLAAPGVAGARA